MFFQSQNAKEIISVLEKNGFEAFFVGGCVRDALMGKTPSDFDICTDATPSEVKNCFKNYKTADTGLRHGTVTVIISGEPFEITTYRIDGEYKDGRRPENVTFTCSVKDDLARRDFTVNAMAFSEKTGLCDFFGGERDIKDKIIRCVGEPSKRFSEDALRILRALRFAAVLGFDIEEKTKKAIFKEKQRLLNIAYERVASELSKLIVSDGAFEILNEYADVIRAVLPFFKTCPDNICFAPKDFATRLALIFGDDTKRCCAVLKLSTKTKNRALFISNNIDKELITKADIKMLLSESDEDSVRLYLNAKHPHLLFLLDEIIKNRECTRLKDLNISGDDIINLGFSGKRTGAVLTRLLKAVIYEKLENKRDILLEYAERLTKMNIGEKSLENHY